MTEQKPFTGKPICTRCLHGHMVEIITGREKTPLEYHCGFCGNYAIVGVPARWPFMEVTKDTARPEEKKTAPDHNERGSSPMQVGESLKPKKEKKNMARKKCEALGCDKKSWLKGLCHKHYVEKYGEYVPEKKGNGVVLPKAAHNKATEEFAYSVRPAESIPPIQLFLYPELLDKLTKAAKKEWRTPEQQAAYLIEKALEAGK